MKFRPWKLGHLAGFEVTAYRRRYAKGRRGEKIYYRRHPITLRLRRKLARFNLRRFYSENFRFIRKNLGQAGKSP